VLPGLIDLHTHLTGELGPGSYLAEFQENGPTVALKSALYARRTLEAGFTTVRDLGDSFDASIALRDAIDRRPPGCAGPGSARSRRRGGARRGSA
jgi:imidazolonepropionase-like amidohydrolase